MLKMQYSAVVGILGAALIAGASSGCSKQQFVKQQFTASAGAVGFRMLPPKVDILMVPDNTGSSNPVFNQLQAQFQSFIGNLNNQYWDYHVGRSPVFYPNGLSPNVGSPILVNPQFNSTTLSDGTPNPSATGLVPSNVAATDPSNFPVMQAPNTTGNGDYTFSNTIAALQSAQADTYTNFLRPDAMLAVVLVTNGYDTTVYNPSTGAVNSSQLAAYGNALLNIKGGAANLVKFYTIASYGYNTNCLVSNNVAFSGIAYYNLMSTMLNGNQFIGGLAWGTAGADLCSGNGLSVAMADIASQLQTVKQDYVYSNIVLADEPIASSIQVTKNGNALSQDPSNGWQYVGLKTVYTITAIRDQKTGQVTPLNPGLSQETGYVIQLNGSAQMFGSDTPNVTYEKK